MGPSDDVTMGGPTPFLRPVALPRHVAHAPMHFLYDKYV